MLVFVIIKNVGIMISVDVNVKNWLTKVYLIHNLFGILVIVNVNVINYVTEQNLDYKNCTCRIKIVDKLSEECSDGNEMIYDGTGNYYEKISNFCTKYIVLLAIAFLISLGISNAYFIFIGT